MSSTTSVQGRGDIDDGEPNDEVVDESGDHNDDEDELAVGDDEFICRSCFLAKRRGQLTDAANMICVDCV